MSFRQLSAAMSDAKGMRSRAQLGASGFTQAPCDAVVAKIPSPIAAKKALTCIALAVFRFQVQTVFRARPRGARFIYGPPLWRSTPDAFTAQSTAPIMDLTASGASPAGDRTIPACR